MPDLPITLASQKIIKGDLFLRGSLVPSTLLETCLNQLLEWLEQQHKKSMATILIDHNIKAFDCKYLMRELEVHNMITRFEKLVLGFVDSLPLFKVGFPTGSYINRKHLLKTL